EIIQQPAVDACVGDGFPDLIKFLGKQHIEDLLSDKSKKRQQLPERSIVILAAGLIGTRRDGRIHWHIHPENRAGPVEHASEVACKQFLRLAPRDWSRDDARKQIDAPTLDGG